MGLPGDISKVTIGTMHDLVTSEANFFGILERAAIWAQREKKAVPEGKRHIAHSVYGLLLPAMFRSQSPSPGLHVRNRTSVELLSGAEVKGMFQRSSGGPMDGRILAGIK